MIFIFIENIQLDQDWSEILSYYKIINKYLWKFIIKNCLKIPLNVLEKFVFSVILL